MEVTRDTLRATGKDTRHATGDTPKSHAEMSPRLSHDACRASSPGGASRPMKPSGIPWLGDIPAEWEIVRLSYRYSVQLGKMLDNEKISGQNLVPYLRNQDVQWDSVNIANLPQMDMTVEERAKFNLILNDLLVCEGGEIGRTAIWRHNVECYFQKAIMRLRTKATERDCPFFMRYVMMAESRAGAFDSATGKSTIAHLPAEKLSATRFAFPPIATQELIVRFLDAKTAAIEELSALKSRIIADAVTGRMEVE